MDPVEDWPVVEVVIPEGLEANDAPLAGGEAFEVGPYDPDLLWRNASLLKDP